MFSRPVDNHWTLRASIWNAMQTSRRFDASADAKVFLSRSFPALGLVMRIAAPGLPPVEIELTGEALQAYARAVAETAAAAARLRAGEAAPAAPP
ncbi:MAG: hypothetical protein KGI36_21645, partial [Burkholderiales bacterium]|nr:hypothetical protein [Burkholderiales bacterium]